MMKIVKENRRKKGTTIIEAMGLKTTRYQCRATMSGRQSGDYRESSFIRLSELPLCAEGAKLLIVRITMCLSVASAVLVDVYSVRSVQCLSVASSVLVDVYSVRSV